MIEIEEDDDDFLSQVAEVEAHALSDSQSRKRRRINSTEVDDEKEKKTVKVKNEVGLGVEGLYMAALRGSNSTQWQQINSNSKNRVNPLPQYVNSNRSNGGSDSDGIPDKSCPCGLGICVVFTANTERNQGRKFYKCPVRQENGGCGFFEWCDSGNCGGNQNSNAISNVPCPCGAGFCLILTAKTGNHIGRQFYRCPANQGSSCGFFKWYDDDVTTASVYPTTAFNPINEMSSKSYGGIRTGSSCFKCGNEGHWARDCPTSLSESRFSTDSRVGTTATRFISDSGSRIAASRYPADSGAGTASGSCYKCGKSGHWARSCNSSESMK